MEMGLDGVKGAIRSAVQQQHQQVNILTSCPPASGLPSAAYEPSVHLFGPPAVNPHRHEENIDSLQKGNRTDNPVAVSIFERAPQVMHPGQFIRFT